MKTSKLIFAAVLGLALSVAPAYAQRGGGGSRGGGGGSHSSGSVSSGSRGGGFSSGSHSSSGGSRSSAGSMSRSSSSSSSMGRSGNSSYSHSRSAGSSMSRSTATYNGNSGASRGNYSGSRSSAATSQRGVSSRGNVASQIRGTAPRSTSPVSRQGQGRSVQAGRAAGSGAPAVGTAANGRPNGRPGNGAGYARPGVPGGMMPPADRPMHPAPYFHHPFDHCMIHMHICPWEPMFWHDWYWPGWWMYCDSYWYDYHMTNYVVVRDYARQNYGIDLLGYAISGDLMYCLVNDTDGQNYLQVYDKNDKLLAEQQINRKYKSLEIDKENGGCWVMKKNGKDPLLFFFNDGQLLIYEAD